MTDTQKEPMEFVLRELEQLRGDICKLRKLIEFEIFGVGGRNGIKTACSKNTEFRENFTKYRVAITGAVVTSLFSLIGLLVRSFLGM